MGDLADPVENSISIAHNVHREAGEGTADGRPSSSPSETTTLAHAPSLLDATEFRNGPFLVLEGKENDGLCILDTMKPKVMKHQQQQQKNNNNISYPNGTLPSLLANGAIRCRQHRSQSPSLFGSSKKRCGPKLDTKERLFGQALPETPKKKLNDTFRSSIFADTAPSSPVKTPKKCVPILERNPITGEVKMPKKITM